MIISESKYIYQEAFGIDEEFDDKLFTVCKKNLITLKKKGKIVSQLFLLPVTIKVNNKNKDAFYLFAAVTKKEYRGKGYMSEHIKRILADTKTPIFLKPAAEGLITFYEQLGFETFTAKYDTDNNYCILPEKEFKALNAPKEEKNGKYTAMIFSKEKLNLENITFSYTME